MILSCLIMYLDCSVAAGPLNFLRLSSLVAFFSCLSCFLSVCSTRDSTWALVGGTKEQYRNYTFHAKIESRCVCCLRFACMQSVSNQLTNQ